MFDTGDLESGVRKHQRMGEGKGDLLQFESHNGHLCYSGGHIKMHHRPPPGGGHQHHTWIGIDHEGISDCGEQRGVVDAVAVGKAFSEIDVVPFGPFLHRGQLAGTPDERSRQRAVIGSVGVDRVFGGNNTVESEQIGKRLHQVIRGGCGQHDRPTCGAMLGEDRSGKRLHHVGKLCGYRISGLLHGLT